MIRGCSTLLQAIALALAALLATAAHGQVEQLVTPPYGAGIRHPNLGTLKYAQPQGGTLVTFKSPREGAPEIVVNGVLFKPSGPANGAVVIVNAAGGWSDAREGHYARSMSSAGYAALAIDTYGQRGGADVPADNATISTHEQSRDAFAARRYLISIGYPSDRVAIMGAGRGGTIALLVADRTFMQGEKEERFAVAMAIGAMCFLHPKAPKPSAKVFMAIGDKDQVAGVKPCQELAKEYVAAGGKATVKIYPGATSGFDGDPSNRTMYRDVRMETFLDCNVAVEADGSSVYDGKTFAETASSALFLAMRKSCSKFGASGYTNVTQKANVTLDLIDFLDANFGR